MKLPNCKKPCKDCPFRKDTLKGWLGAERMTEILNANSFVCHKNTSLQCAGHLIIKGDENVYHYTAGKMGIDLKLKGHDLIFESKQGCINHHKIKPMNKPLQITKKITNEILFRNRSWKKRSILNH